jgi:IPT/TIG domain
MLYILIMSTDADIVNVQLGDRWPAPTAWYNWNQIELGGLNIPNGATIVVIAHGNRTEIGNAYPGTIDINAAAFLAIIRSNMAAGAVPSEIYISACQGGIAEFAAAVALICQGGNTWQQTTIYGHSDAVIGPVPNPNTLAWYAIFTHRHLVESGPKSVLGGGAPQVSWPPTKLVGPATGAKDYNVPAVKYYVFNETGNIMLATTQGKGNESVNPSTMALFAEVAVFFAAMTKAITTTPRRGATPPYAPTDYYTIYDYDALEGIVNGSGMFINVNREDLQYSTSSVTVTFTTEFIEALLGIALTDGVGAAALLATLNAMGKQATFSYASTQKYHQIGNLLFVCEYLVGMPIVSVLYFYLDQQAVQTVVTASPCVTVSDTSFDLTIHKDTFLFVPPAWIREYGGDLASVAGDEAYQELIKQLQALITTVPLITTVSPSGTTITAGAKVTLGGVNFGGTVGRVLIGGIEQKVAAADWTSTSVAFTAANATGSDVVAPIVLVTAGKTAATSSLEYTLKHA